MKEAIEYLKYKEIVKNKEINAYLEKGNANLGQLGFTDHSQAHCVQVAHQAGKILERFGYSEHEVELVKIAGYMHDIGNAINRTHHAEYGALLANDLLKDTDMSLEDRITVMSAIGNHDESTGDPEDVISAALIIADKTDVRRSRIFFQMFIPTMKSTYAAAMTITFMNAWNSYMWPKVIMTESKSMTMPMVVANLTEGYVTDYGMLMLAVLICTLPTALVFFILQKSFAEGITGAVK